MLKKNPKGSKRWRRFLLFRFLLLFPVSKYRSTQVHFCSFPMRSRPAQGLNTFSMPMTPEFYLQPPPKLQFPASSHLPDLLLESVQLASPTWPSKLNSWILLSLLNFSIPVNAGVPNPGCFSAPHLTICQQMLSVLSSKCIQNLTIFHH